VLRPAGTPVGPVLNDRIGKVIVGKAGYKSPFYLINRFIFKLLGAEEERKLQYNRTLSAFPGPAGKCKITTTYDHP
jgi:hypothetical protein